MREDPFTTNFGPRHYRLKFEKVIEDKYDELLMNAIISNYDLLMILHEEPISTVKLYQSRMCDDGFKIIIIRQRLKDVLSLEFYEEYDEDTKQDVEKQEK